MNEQTDLVVIDLVYDVLQAFGANPDMRLGFARWFNEPDQHEWRFQGELGFGGKFWHNPDRWYVNCYREDESKLRADIIAAINVRLAALRRFSVMTDTSSPTWSRIARLQSELRTIAEECRDRVETAQAFESALAAVGTLVDVVRGNGNE